MDNLKKTEFVISAILSALMDRGIQHGLLGSDELIEDDDLRRFVGPCFEWLMDEGIVRAAEVSETMGGHFTATRPALTSLGFKLMGQTIKLNDTELKLADAVRQTSNERKSFSQLGDFFGGILGGFTKSMGS